MVPALTEWDALFSAKMSPAFLCMRFDIRGAMIKQNRVRLSVDVKAVMRELGKR